MPFLSDVLNELPFFMWKPCSTCLTVQCFLSSFPLQSFGILRILQNPPLTKSCIRIVVFCLCWSFICAVFILRNIKITIFFPVFADVSLIEYLIASVCDPERHGHRVALCLTEAHCSSSVLLWWRWAVAALLNDHRDNCSSLKLNLDNANKNQWAKNGNKVNVEQKSI